METTLRHIAALLMDIAVYSVIPAALVALWRLPKASREQRLIAGFVLFSALCELGAFYLAGQGIRNLWIAHLVTVVRFPLLAWLYRDYYPRKILLSLIAAFTAFALIDSLWLENPKEVFNAIGRSVEAILLLGLALGFMYQMLRYASLRHLERVPMLWATISIVLFFSGSLIIYIFNNQTLLSPIQSELFGGLYALFLIIHYALMALALGMKPKGDVALAENIKEKKGVPT